MRTVQENLPLNDSIVYCEISKLTYSQIQLQRSIEKCKVSVAIGGLGCGKTSISLLTSLQEVIDRKTKKLILSTPIEPLDSPYNLLLNSMIQSQEALQQRVQYSTLEELKRSTLKNCIVIIDECQHASPIQIMHIINRLGRGARLVLLGDTYECNKESSKDEIFLQRLVSHYHFRDDLTHSSIKDNELSIVLFDSKKDNVLKE